MIKKMTSLELIMDFESRKEINLEIHKYVTALEMNVIRGC